MRQEIAANKNNSEKNKRSGTINLRDEIAVAFRSLLFATTKRGSQGPSEARCAFKSKIGNSQTISPHCSTQKKIDYIKRIAQVAFPDTTGEQIMIMRYIALMLRKQGLINHREVNTIAKAIADHLPLEDKNLSEGIAQILSFSMHLGWDLQLAEKLELAILLVNRLFPMLQDPDLLSACYWLSCLSSSKRKTVEFALQWFNSNHPENSADPLELIQYLREIALK